MLGIDLSAGMIERARAESANYPNMRLETGDVMTMDFLDGSFDCIASIATLHHVPLDAVLVRFKRWLKLGGTLLVLDLMQGEGVELLMHGAAVLINPIMKRRYGVTPGSEEANNAWAAHGDGESYNTSREVRQACSNLLPGAVVKAHLYYRYSLVWKKRAKG